MPDLQQIPGQPIDPQSQPGTDRTMEHAAAVLNENAPPNHMLAFITQDEAMRLRQMGGGIGPDGGQMQGPGGIPAFKKKKPPPPPPTSFLPFAAPPTADPRVVATLPADFNWETYGQTGQGNQPEAAFFVPPPAPVDETVGTGGTGGVFDINDPTTWQFWNTGGGGSIFGSRLF